MIDDAKLIEFESNELFLTLFDLINNVEFVLIINLLADKTFEHRFIAKNDITILEIVSYIYISIIESRYDDREFKSILMNCDVARRSTIETEQFTALQRLNDSIKLDQSTVESKIQFDIDSISIMSTIELNISLKQLIFYIVEINTFFLLCLVDLNSLDAYFNNLINELMQKCLIIIILQIDMKNVDKNRRFSVIRRYEHAFLL
jgi:DNA-binding cell septation regulator SpoVG